ncbi:D-3-phosphoglycerate dehydrogenase [Minicystis rosea]|nr:D-3-phosphoglycerate dehydrogenase [Minicystis rosea]
MGNVLVSAPLPGPAIDLMRAEHHVDVGADPIGLGREGIVARIADRDALVTLVTDRIDEAVLAAAPRLRVVANCGVGVDNIDLEACRRRGVAVTNTPDVLTEATADATLALMLDACRRITEGDRAVRAGHWRGWAPTEWIGARVTGAALGIIGLGRIGRAVAARARGFSMRVLYAQPRRAADDDERALSARHVSLDELLASSDIVVLTCRLDDTTRNLLSRDRIARLKPGAVVVNTARGACIDEVALADALRTGHVAAAGLDVFVGEPRVAPILLELPNVVLTPHLGSADRPTREAMARICADAVLAVLAGREPRCRLV